MPDDTKNRCAVVLRTAHGKPYYMSGGIGVETHESTLPDALDLSSERALKEIEEELRSKYPDAEPLLDGFRPDFIADLRSLERKVERDEFVEAWHQELHHAQTRGVDSLEDSFRRVVRVKLGGMDRVRWWSGWFHYAAGIENSRREMKESGGRLQTLFNMGTPGWRNVVEEAYYEQVQRERLAIFERRREWWRVIRWGSATVLGAIIGAWHVMLFVERIVGGW